MRPTRVEINLDNIAHNISEIHRRIGDKVKIMAVVKANGYGHGAVEVARTALESGVQWLAVAMFEEAVGLREDGIQSPILVLGLSPPAEAGELVKYRLAQAVCTGELAQALSAEAKLQGQDAKVHVKVDTGLGRLGILPEEARDFVRDISHLRGIEIEGIFTHFSVADIDRRFTELQMKKFQGMLASLEKAGISLSCGRTFITRKKSRIATLPVGYTDGYTRALSNKGEVLIKGKRAPVVGRVCMDMILVDVSHIPDVKVGDEVVLFGRQDGAQLSVDEIASKIGTINYEVLCGIDRRVPRVYIKGDKS